MGNNSWSKEWKPGRLTLQRVRWYNLAGTGVRIEFKDNEGNKHQVHYSNSRLASEHWEDFKRGALTISELRSAGYS